MSNYQLSIINYQLILIALSIGIISGGEMAGAQPLKLVQPNLTPRSTPTKIEYLPLTESEVTTKELPRLLPVPTVKPLPTAVQISKPVQVLPKPNTQSPIGNTSPPPPPPPPPKSSLTPPKGRIFEESPNNPLAAPQNVDELLKRRITEDIWMAMYSPLSCLDINPDCLDRLQQEAVQNSPVIRELEAKISTINTKIEEAKTNNKKSIELSVFEPALQVFLKQDTVVENGQSRRIGFLERVGQLFTSPVPLVNDLLSAIGIPLLRGSYGGNDAQQSRAIQISDLIVKVAEIERVKTEVAAKTREKVQQLVLDFDVLAREFQAEVAIARSEEQLFKLYAIAYSAGDGDTNTYLHRKGQLERTKLQVFKSWARVRGQITVVKTMVVPRE